MKLAKILPAAKKGHIGPRNFPKFEFIFNLGLPYFSRLAILWQMLYFHGKIFKSFFTVQKTKSDFTRFLFRILYYICNCIFTENFSSAYFIEIGFTKILSCINALMMEIFQVFYVHLTKFLFSLSLEGSCKNIKLLLYLCHVVSSS